MCIRDSITSGSDTIKVFQSGETDNLNYIKNNVTSWSYNGMRGLWTVVLTSVTHTSIDEPSVLFRFGGAGETPGSGGISLFVPDNSNVLYMSSTNYTNLTSSTYSTNIVIEEAAPSLIVICGGGTQGDFDVWQVKNNSVYSSNAHATANSNNDHFYIGGHALHNVYYWKGTVGKFYFYNNIDFEVSGNNFHDHFLNVATEDHSIDGSTNIRLYDNTIKSQLIKLLKRGGTSEANPTSGTNLQRY